MRALTIVAAVLLAGSARAPAQQAACSGRIVADLGFSGMTFSQGHTYVTEGLTLFGTEPVLTGIDPAGPAAGRLEDGDALVAVAGLLITTRAGAELFAGLRPGIPVTLTIRRHGQNRLARIVPAARCEPAPEPLPNPARLVVRATLGVGLTCGPCWNATRVDGTIVWGFENPPEVRQVLPGSAADRAGFRPGDRIESIDGEAITSAEGGRRFGALEPGRPVRLAVRRGNARVELTVVPGKE